MSKKDKNISLGDYIRSVIVLIILIVTFGVFAPGLISSDSNELVILGFILVIIAMPIIWIVINPVIKKTD